MINVDFSGNPAQGQFLGSQDHFAAAVSGIGGGKSFAGCVRGLAAAFGYIGSQKKLITPNVGVITAPTYGMLEDATIRTFLEVAGDTVVSYTKSPQPHAKLSNGSEVLFRSTDNAERLRGPNISWCMMDEAALSPELAFNVLIGRLRQHGQFGYLWLTTTPKGRNWIYKRFVQKRRKNYRLYNWATWQNAALSREYIQALKESYVGDFYAQELEGKFIAFQGLIYGEFDREEHIRSQMPKRFSRVIAGVDWGYTNPGVILVGGVDFDNRLWVIHEAYQRQKHIDDWVATARELQSIYGVEEFVCDPSKPDFISKFTDEGLYASGANNTVSTGIQSVKRRLISKGGEDPRLVLYPGAVYTASEFESYQWKPDKGEAETYRDEPMKVNDHTMDALRYMVMELDEITPLEASANSYGYRESA